MYKNINMVVDNYVSSRIDRWYNAKYKRAIDESTAKKIVEKIKSDDTLPGSFRDALCESGIDFLLNQKNNFFSDYYGGLTNLVLDITSPSYANNTDAYTQSDILGIANSFRKIKDFYEGVEKIAGLYPMREVTDFEIDSVWKYVFINRDSLLKSISELAFYMLSHQATISKESKKDFERNLQNNMALIKLSSLIYKEIFYEFNP